ncbi:hypothetical protein WJX73_008948 [Symbiochloris irregularis]|uniref:TauD/TfdA-like domain-containing protein n=1 Tax=Symbiochloris irregularis TaxID=706552 RepID=A0AAW1PNC2_9CHLO
MATAVAKAVPVDFDEVGAYNDKLEGYIQKVGAAKAPEKPVKLSELEHSKQGSVKPLTIIDSPADWTAASLKGRESEWIYNFTEQDTEELVSAVEKVKASGVATEDDVLKLTGDDLDLPTLRPKIHELGKRISNEWGFQLVRGFPVDRFKTDRLGLIIAFYGLGLVFGRPQVSQTDYTEDGQTFGSVLNHISEGRHSHVRRNINYPPPPAASGQENQKKREVDLARLAFHSDQAATDLVALLSVTAAKQGGESKWVSGIAIHNELLRRGRKDLVEALSDEQAWRIPTKHDQATYKRNADGSFQGHELMPPFHYHDGYLSIYFQTNNYQEVEDQLTPLQLEAVWTFAKLAEDPEYHITIKLQPGDIELLHNPTVCHSRAEVSDGEAPEEKRHLLRWWFAQPPERNPRPIAKSYAPRSNVGPEGGFRVPEGSKLRLPFWPYGRHDGLGKSTY